MKANTKTSQHWLGEMPLNWSAVPIKRLFNIVNGATPKSDDPAFWDGDIVWVTPSDLSDRTSKYIKESKRKLTATGFSSCGTSLAPKSSIVLSTRAPIGSLALAGHQLCTNQGCKSLAPSASANSEYYDYVLQAAGDELQSIGKGTTFLEVSTESLASMQVPFPPIEVQTAIARFLDFETTRIDALIDEQKKLIELLKEKRQALISQAVTKGLDLNVPTKPSGVKWLENIPAHWDVLRLQRLLKSKPKNGLSPPISGSGKAPTFSTAAIKHLKVEISKNLKMADTSAEASKDARVKKGDIYILRGSGNQSFVGTAAIVEETPPEGCIFPDLLIRVSPSPKLNPEYLIRLLSSRALRAQIETSSATASGIWKVSGASVSDWRIPVPPIEEQRSLVAHSKVIEQASRDTRERAKALSALLRERRAALITAAVTGQIDVSSYKPSSEPAPT